jgi:hypothetical protein
MGSGPPTPQLGGLPWLVTIKITTCPCLVNGLMNELPLQQDFKNFLIAIKNYSTLESTLKGKNAYVLKYTNVPSKSYAPWNNQINCFKLFDN